VIRVIHEEKGVIRKISGKIRKCEKNKLEKGEGL